MTALYRGGCLCGTVRFQACGTLTDQCFCHCASCRRAAGASPVLWGTVEREAFGITQGVLREVRSSPTVVRSFCGMCGTSIAYQNDSKPSELDLALATLDDLEAVRPQCHIWVEDKPTWFRIADGLPQFAHSSADLHAAPLRAPRLGYATISARIVVQDVDGLVAFIKHVFLAQGQSVPGRPTEVRIGDSTLLISEPGPRAHAAAFLYVYVPDVEATHARALELGARELEAPVDTSYGDRRSTIEDAWQNTWQIARIAS